MATRAEARIMPGTKSLVSRHSVLMYFALVFLFSWGALLILAPGGFALRSAQFASLGPLVYLAIIAGPSVAGLLMIAIVDGMPGIREFLARLGRWRVAARWYALALVPALVMAAATLLLSSISTDFRPAVLAADDKLRILIAALGPSLLVGAFEEIGWTGFAVPHMRARHSILVTGMIVGIVWGAWHFPLFWEADTFSGVLPFTLLLTRLFVWLPPFRVLLIAIHERTRSLPVVMLMHAAVSFVSIVFAYQGVAGARSLASPLAAAATMWLLVAAMNMANRRRVARTSQQPRTA
jgi:membrane protease YdiL (CAAX protease family)